MGIYEVIDADGVVIEDTDNFSTAIRVGMLPGTTVHKWIDGAKYQMKNKEEK